MSHVSKDRSTDLSNATGARRYELKTGSDDVYKTALFLALVFDVGDRPRFSYDAWPTRSSLYQYDFVLDLCPMPGAVDPVESSVVKEGEDGGDEEVKEPEAEQKKKTSGADDAASDVPTLPPVSRWEGGEDPSVRPIWTYSCVETEGRNVSCLSYNKLNEVRPPPSCPSLW